MNKDKTISIIVLTSILTILAVYKRLYYLSDGKTFEIELGRTLLTPYFFLFSFLTALVLTAPLNYKVGKEVHRGWTNYYNEKRDRKRFLKALNKDPIKALAVNDSKRVAKHLKLPEWLTASLKSFLSKSVKLFKGLPYLGVLTISTFITLIYIVIWKK